MTERGGFVVVLSGGLDSCVLLWHLNTMKLAGRAVTIDYGQRHKREVNAATRLAGMAQVPHDVVRLPMLAAHLPGSSQTDKAIQVPRGHYEDATMRATVVPNRNMILLAVALGVAVAHDLRGVAYGAHAGDHAIYPDCRPAFIDAMRLAARVCDYTERELSAPFTGKSKAEIVAIGHELAVPFDETWTCYEGGTMHCGQCGACTERREAFVLARVGDPTRYLH